MGATLWQLMQTPVSQNRGRRQGRSLKKSAALFAYGQLTGVWGRSLSQSLPTVNKHLNPPNCEYTVFFADACFSKGASDFSH